MSLFTEPCASGSDWAPALVLLFCPGKSVVAEVYPSLWTRRFPKEDRDGDEQAAYAAAAWLQRAGLSGSLESFFNPPLTPEEREVAAMRGGFWASCEPAAKPNSATA
jgi:hypothetical protein